MMVLLIFLAKLAECKLFSSTVTLTPQESWAYLSKFAMSVGQGEYSIKVQLVGPINKDSSDNLSIVSNIYIDTTWTDVPYLTDCKEKEHLSNREAILLVPRNGEWSNTIEGRLKQNVRTRFWYFALSTCDTQEKFKVRVEIHFLNSNGEEFSAEDNGLQYVYPMILMVYFMFLFRNMLSIVWKFEKSDDIAVTLVIFNGAILTQFGAIFFKVIHLWIYWYNGKGFLVFDILHQALEVISAIILTVLFILIANGWTLKYRDFPDADIYIPISMLIVSINLIVVAVGKISDDAYNKYTDYEGISAFFIIVFRILSWCWFIYVIKDLDNDRNKKITDFVFKFKVIVSIYFWSMPFLVIFSWVFEPYVRKLVIVLLSNLIQVNVFFYTSHLFSEKSQFYKISTLSQSVLPGSAQ